MSDAQHQELTSFLSRLVSDEHAPDSVYEVAARAYDAMFKPDGASTPMLTAAHAAVWTALEQADYLPPDYVLGTY
jgi:hypothetical protein